MNHCKDCKWWERWPDPPADGDRRHTGNCNNPKLVGWGMDGLFAGETESYPCAPCTGPEFGCVHWEAKEQCLHPLGSRVQKDSTWRCDQCGQVFSGDALEGVSA